MSKKSSSSNVSSGAKNALLIILGLIIVSAIIFFIFKPNMEKKKALDEETKNFQNHVNYLSTLQLAVNDMQAYVPLHEKYTIDYTNTFRCKMTQQKALYDLYLMMKKTGVNIDSVAPGVEQKFMEAGAFIPIQTSVNQPSDTTAANNNNNQKAAKNPAEANPETRLTLDKMVGKCLTYEVGVTGTRKQIMKAIDWIKTHKEHLAIESQTYTVVENKLSGTMRIRFYSLNGNGCPYEDPDIKGIKIGSKNVFKTFVKKVKKNG